MLHAKLQDHRTLSSGEEDFLRFLSYIDMAAMLVMCPRPVYKFMSSLSKEAPNKIWLCLAKLFQSRRCLKRISMCMYIAQGQRQTTPYGQNVFINTYIIIYSVNLVISCKFSH